MTDTEAIIQGLIARDWRALAKAITIVENQQEGADALLAFAYERCTAPGLLLGITGAGGSGKSTLISGLIDIYGRRGLRVGVLAVDPTSSYTGGAVLGDRIRLKVPREGHRVFFRSFASRGSLGGLSQGAKNVLYLYKAFGFDVIILESYGVGQAETDITNYVDVTAVVLAPGNGDYIQHAKAGTQEIADIFVVNKADRIEADALFTQLSAALETVPAKRRPVVLKTVASEGVGILELSDEIERLRMSGDQSIEKKKYLRIENEIYSGAIMWLAQKLKAECARLTELVAKGEMTPFLASKKIADSIVWKDERRD